MGQLVRISRSVLFLLLVWPGMVSAARQEKPVWLAVTRPMFKEALEPLADKRRGEGFEVRISTESAVKAIHEMKPKPSYILLVGDDMAGAEREAWYLPSRKFEFYRWREVQETIYSSDMAWGDLDGDLSPDVPVGRIPARTVSQVETMVAKILIYEDGRPGLEGLFLPVWAGRSEFGDVADTLTTGLFLQSLYTHAPAWVRLWMISADPRHALCGWPPDQAKLYAEQLKKGGLLGILIGHGREDSFYSMRFSGRSVRFRPSDCRDVFAQGRPCSPLVVIACYCGSFSGARPSLAESLLMMPGGPVGVIAASTESHPLTNGFTFLSLLGALDREYGRLGELWLETQKKAVRMRHPLMEAVLAGIEGKREKVVDQTKLRRDHFLMYAILGDPATRLHRPGRLHGRIDTIEGGWHWQVDRPSGANELRVDFRPVGRSMPKVMEKMGRETARDRYRQAIKSLAFEPLKQLTVEQSWEGTIHREGILRLTARGEGNLYVTALRLQFTEGSDSP